MGSPSTPVEGSAAVEVRWCGIVGDARDKRGKKKKKPRKEDVRGRTSAPGNDTFRTYGTLAFEAVKLLLFDSQRRKRGENDGTAERK